MAMAATDVFRCWGKYFYKRRSEMKRRRQKGGAHNRIFKEVVFLVVLFEEENIGVLPRPRAVHIYHLLMVLQLSLWGQRLALCNRNV